MTRGRGDGGLPGSVDRDEGTCRRVDEVQMCANKVRKAKVCVVGLVRTVSRLDYSVGTYFGSGRRVTGRLVQVGNITVNVPGHEGGERSKFRVNRVEETGVRVTPR